ncbi:MAG TPA: hypothetical protein VFS35_01290 [Terrimicrobiaceae bacterium]|nr:hypothetical protein [Terrimicrobiaceae bacterium]
MKYLSGIVSPLENCANAGGAVRNSSVVDFCSTTVTEPVAARKSATCSLVISAASIQKAAHINAIDEHSIAGRARQATEQLPVTSQPTANSPRESTDVSSICAEPPPAITSRASGPDT